MAHVYFDISGVAGVGQWTDKQTLIVQRIREVGISRILFGSDGAFGGGMAPAEALAAYRKLPLTDQEFQTIDSNLTSYMRW